MLETATYLVTRDIAVRSGLLDSRYRVSDGRFVLNDRDLSRVRLTVDEYVSGLEGVVRITSEQAQDLIRQNRYAIGDNESSGGDTENVGETETVTAPKQQTEAAGDSDNTDNNNNEITEEDNE